ncbi:uncharacterized protein G2W53_015893 [Senna tora]|uniref:Uncharacterized protein n=1 Tax=Senna tora TaxID=362788 RepID=A0A834WWE4_9FABA|nr:uncharacterized protein G2W53_015893 [Senna tora]
MAHENLGEIEKLGKRQQCDSSN